MHFSMFIYFHHNLTCYCRFFPAFSHWISLCLSCFLLILVCLLKQGSMKEPILQNNSATSYKPLHSRMQPFMPTVTQKCSPKFIFIKEGRSKPISICFFSSKQALQPIKTVGKLTCFSNQLICIFMIFMHQKSLQNSFRTFKWRWTQRSLMAESSSSGFYSTQEIYTNMYQ